MQAPPSLLSFRLSPSLALPPRSRTGAALDAIGRDDCMALQRWLQDPATHLEDTEPSKSQTATTLFKKRQILNNLAPYYSKNLKVTKFVTQ